MLALNSQHLLADCRVRGMQQRSTSRLTLAFIQLMVLAAIAYLGFVVVVTRAVSTESASHETSTGFQEVAGIQQRPPSDLAAVISGRALQRSLEEQLYLEAYGVPTPEPVVPRATRGLDVHIGPGSAYAVLGVVPNEARLDVVGRNDKGDWVAIVFTPGSNFHGWIPASGTSGLGDVMRLPVVPLSPLRGR
jgi:hypothetical protein